VRDVDFLKNIDDGSVCSVFHWFGGSKGRMHCCRSRILYMRR
jgi:hypothetical protein